MKIFLVWHYLSGSRETINPKSVGKNLQKLYSPLFRSPPALRVLQNHSSSVVLLEQSIKGWKAPFYQEDSQTCAFSTEYPVNARRVLMANGVKFKSENILPVLCRSMQDDPGVFLSEMSPPFSLVWLSRKTNETFLQNDGLGQSQLFEYQDSHLWAMSNKITAFKALGIPLELEKEQWAVRSTLGWFPLDMTGYKRIQFFSPGTQIRLSPHHISRIKTDSLSDWLTPLDLPQSDCFEHARRTLLEHIKDFMSLCEQPFVGLSGGWDTRAIVSSLRALDADFIPFVRGLPNRPDVLIASKLANIALLNLQIDNSGGLPPNDPQRLRRCIELALLWQGGFHTTEKHKSFFGQREGHGIGRITIMGQHGEIGRGYYEKKIHSKKLEEDQYEVHLLRRLMRKMPPYMKKNIQEYIYQVLLEAYGHGNVYGLTGNAKLDFFYLNERTRRWASASLNSSMGLRFAPFLNIGYIRSVFSSKSLLKDENPFHRYIITKNSPDWENVPYANELLNKKPVLKEFSSAVQFNQNIKMASTWRQPVKNKNYNNALYWEKTGSMIIQDALNQGGLWEDIFDPQVTKKKWQAAPDDLAIMHILPDIIKS